MLLKNEDKYGKETLQIPYYPCTMILISLFWRVKNIKIITNYSQNMFLK